MRPLPAVGTKIVVLGIHFSRTVPIVANVTWDEDRQDWKIALDWKEHGMSFVLAHDEGDVWVRYEELN